MQPAAFQFTVQRCADHWRRMTQPNRQTTVVHPGDRLACAMRAAGAMLSVWLLGHAG